MTASTLLQLVAFGLATSSFLVSGWLLLAPELS